MAKAPKKRVKKANMVDIKRKEVNNIINLCYQGVAFLGDCFHNPRCMNIQRLYTHLRGPYHELGMDSFLRHLMREMDWSLGVVCYFKDPVDEEQIHVVNVHAVFEKDFNMIEVSKNLSSVIIECINRALDADERFTNDNFIYYAYVLVPEYHKETHTARTDGLGDLMINLGEIHQFEPFCENLPGIPSDEKTLTNAIVNNGIFPKIKKREYWPVDVIHYLYEGVDDVSGI